MTKRVTVIFSDEEYRQVKEIAGLVPMSAWLRALALYTRATPKKLVEGVIGELNEKSCASQPVTAPVMTGKDDAVSANAPSARTSRKQPLKELDMSICPHNMTKAACPRCK